MEGWLGSGYYKSISGRTSERANEQRTCCLDKHNKLPLGICVAHMTAPSPSPFLLRLCACVSLLYCFVYFLFDFASEILVYFNNPRVVRVPDADTAAG